MIRVLIDTDIFIDFLRGIETAKRIFEEDIINEKIIAFSSVISEAELFSGKECKYTEKRRAVEELISLTNKIEVDSQVAKKAGEFRRIFKTPLTDSLIAATAHKINAILYTRNVKHYEKIKEIKLKIPY